MICAGMDEGRETRSLTDAEQDVGNIMRHWKILCVLLCFYPFLFLSYLHSFFQNYPADQRRKVGRQY